MIDTAVVLPAAPLLLPGVTGRPVPQAEQLRSACLQALSAVNGRVVVVAAEPARHDSRVSRPERASKAPFRIAGDTKRDTPVGHPSALHRIAPGLTAPAQVPVLPVELEVGRSLLVAAGLDPDQATFRRLPATLTRAQAADLGTRLAADARPTSLVALADGSPGRRESGSPVRYDPRAAAFDLALLNALRAGDSAALTGLDAALARDLQVGCYLPLQVLAAGIPSPRRAEVSYADDPFGVFYLIARWSS